MRTDRNREESFYNEGVMAGRPPSKEAPPFGQRLAAARKSCGWSQSQLADKLETTQKVIDYYERRAVNPSLAFIERAAQALDVPVAELAGGESKPAGRRPGPPSQLARRLEQIRRLSRKDQEFILEVLDRFLQTASR
jgi:transcriptional regulator with XRE-family HTH domain